MEKALFCFLIFMPQLLWASQSYMLGSPTDVQFALEAEYGIGSGVGTRDGQCLLCHGSPSGGPGNIPVDGFGRDFQETAQRLGIGTGGNSLVATGGSNSLQAIFADSTFRNLDSDDDGLSNEEEFELNSDPNSNAVNGAGPSGSSGGGCGIIGGNNPRSPWTNFLFLLLPLIIILTPRKLGIKKAKH